MAPPKLYMVDVSPPVRSVLLTAKAIGITLDYKQPNFSKSDKLAPAFLKVRMPKKRNGPFFKYLFEFQQIPQRTVPTLVDNGYIIWDSHHILAFLIGKYANDDTLYPRENIQRTIIDQRLHFDSEVLFANISCIVVSILSYGQCRIKYNVL